MGTLAGLWDWWNLIFLLPIALSVLLLLASAVGGLGEAGAHGAVDASAHGAVDADADVETDAPGEAQTDHPLADALEWAGVGVVPISLLAQAFLLLFGMVGLAANRALETAARPDSLIWGALGIALGGSLAGTAALGALGRRFLPREKPALGNKDLVGRTGSVVFTVTQTLGTIQVRDSGGTLHQLAARIPAGQEPLESGRDVLVTAFDPESGAFLVDESPFSLTPEELRRRA